jgi:dimethylhistidine N-methyltransferase
MNLRPKTWRSEATGPSSEASLLERFLSVRDATERLAAPLGAEDQLLQSMPDASPVKWHRAHTTWFFETFILKRQPSYREFHPAFSFLFNSYYEAVGARHPRPQRGLLSRPTVEEISDYRRHVDEAMCALLAGAIDDETADLIELGLNHEQQHQELILTDILHAFAQNPLRPAYAETTPSISGAPGSAGFIDFEGGTVEIGHAGEGFAFDNESPRHRAILEPYRLAERPVTNGEWLEFLLAGGYRDAALWLSDGWQCAASQSWRAPLYWEEKDGAWLEMTLAGLKPLDPEAPVAHVSFYEADAFARWRGKRLPSEAEWENATRGLDPRDGNFVESGALRPLPPSAPGSRQMFGDVWEWTASAYAPYPGYRPAAGAVGEYNGKFMINQMVLRGGSCATPASHMRASYRNFFYPQQRWQFSGLRLAEDAPRGRGKRTDSDAPSQFLADVWNGLSRPQKRLDSKYFYDGRGAELFEQICGLPEYYLTRTETALLHRLAPELAASVAPGTVLVEFGCGSAVKTRVLLDALSQLSCYLAIDICGYSLEQTTSGLKRDYPALDIRSLVADFMEAIALPGDFHGRPLLGFFPGSTIGNLTDAEAEQFLARARQTLGPQGRLLIGIDLVKECETLLAAYNDSAGVTAAFNKNVLARIQRELDTGLDLDAFEHRALWNEAAQRIEMHLVSWRAQRVTIAGREFHFAAGESIHTENCHKYTVEGFTALAERAGWSVQARWQSAKPEFALLLLG